ncbi:MAG: hypothetical protein R2778_13210 [Saprospiraceae bacterium]
MYHYNQAYGGQSGSNSYYKDANNNRYVHAVLSHRNNQHTGHTRLTSGKFSDIQSIIQGNIPGSPDLVPMAVQPVRQPFRLEIALAILVFATQLQHQRL